ncbi:2-amino-4-hydroxy-6-hydroxymethyldihydropteridine diphosphokinase [Defluviimonas aestuarii]|uniref:2-amino-4-hydroxy-6- hydroxymethyldihydropteridine diphosphokinase n=1 Tax=Albidovulum aestuarii TaxID=1130726 RepID=UPI00249C23B9|nr:2-amino-4-hydroxy-6-hydroxymethyldihydropteridine diphosphokinase [Defluviimonas aestuarii]MDI3338236.1 2-amino-4-hydroxy-6-hydroxymethyldihydropteridine diphosphokinase [Defluviimonas aestuarii]
MDKLAAIAIGSNSPSGKGDSLATVISALVTIHHDIGQIVAVSRFFRTPAYPPGSGPDFVNAAALVASSLSPEGLLAALHRIEAEAGRTREIRWGARTLDLDLLIYGDTVMPDSDTQKAWMALPLEKQKQDAPDRLILPHPRLQDRGFVLIPLAEIAPAMIHPVTGLSVAEMVSALSKAEKAAICPL